MDFRLSEKQLEWKRLAEEFARKEIAPHMVELDRRGEFSLDIWRKMGELNLLGMIFPKKYGGGGQDVLSMVMAMEGLGAGGCSFGSAMAWHPHMNDCGMGIVEFGSEEQKRKYLPKMATGEWIGCFGLTEPGAGSDAAALRTTAERRGDYFVLNGTKKFITNAPVCDLALVLTYTDISKGNKEGMSAFIVEKDFKGFSKGRPVQMEKMGERTVTTGELYFNDCEVPAANLLGKEGDGWRVLRHCTKWERVGPLAMLIGMIENVLDRCVDYSKKRITFGKPIAEHQAIQHKLADIKIALETSRILLYWTVWKHEAGILKTMDVSIAKIYIPEALMKASMDAIQVFGGIGYFQETEVERAARDIRLMLIAGGPSEIHRNIIGGRLTS